MSGRHRQGPSLPYLPYVRDVLGFDRSTRSGKAVRVKCSQCEALVVNSQPTHETGCPNATHGCRGCNARVPMRQRYCEDCS